MASIPTEVDKIISGITGSLVNDFSATLNSLGITGEKLSELASQLDAFVNEKRSGASIGEDQITGGLTVQQVIDIVSGVLGR
ncbi:MAG TPA: hypothetical protein VHB54_18835 [Mucilaginibacter sp.]|nr:hypothetical protein [Mucilaginibacter sp.]